MQKDEIKRIRRTTKFVSLQHKSERTLGVLMSLGRKNERQHTHMMYGIRKDEKIHLSCIRSTKNVFLIKTQLCKLRVIVRSRLLRGMYTLVKDTGR